MIKLQETIHVNRQPADIYIYLKNFASCAEWDPTVIEAKLTSAGPITVGSEFRVKCALPVGSITLNYTIEELIENEKIVLRGTSRFFEVLDTIQIQSTAGAVHLIYTAEFEFNGALASLEKQFRPGLIKMGEESIQHGLKIALDDNFPAPTQSRKSSLEDKLIVPGISRFTRRGYRLGRKIWNPVSANITGKHVLLTGSTAGLGLSAARQLASMGASLTLVARDKQKGQDLVAELKQATGNTDIHLELADLALMSDTDRLINRLKKRATPIDVCINNAGALFNEWAQTAEGLERSFALLLLSPYRLLLGIKPLLSAGSRVINVVSGGMYTQKLNVDELHTRSRGYTGAVAYARAKRAMVVLTEELAREWDEDHIVVNSMHPGWAATPGVESSLPAFYRLTQPLLRTPEEGADTMVWLAAATEAGKATGQLFLDREPHNTHLLTSTRESDQERAQLLEMMAELVNTRPSKLAGFFEPSEQAA
jgi:NAD(P)-dependent dehydrogenase (short-subunit alcohol dehydrogenase family)